MCWDAKRILQTQYFTKLAHNMNFVYLAVATPFGRSRQLTVFLRAPFATFPPPARGMLMYDHHYDDAIGWITNII